MKNLYLIILGLFLLPSISFGLDRAVDISKVDKKLWLGYQAYAYEDSTGQLTIQDLATGEHDQLFSLIDERIHNAGYNGNSQWVSFQLHNPTDQPAEMVLEIQGPNINKIKLYELNNDSIKSYAALGQDFPYHHAHMVNGSFEYELIVQPQSTYNYYLNAQNNIASLRLPMILWNEVAYRQHLTKAMYFNGAFIGILLLVILLAFLAFILLQEAIYFWYILYITGILAFLAHGFGLFHQFIFPNQPGMNDPVTVTISLAALALLIRFSEVFLDLPKKTRIGTTIVRLSYIILGCIYLLWLFNINFDMLTQLSIFLYSLIPALCFGIFMYVSIKGSIKGDRDSLIYLSAFAPLILFSMAIILRNHDFIPHYPVLNYRIPIGLTFEAIIFFFALTYRYKLMNDERSALLVKVNEIQTQLFRKVIEAVEGERKRIAIDLHDGLGQMLSTLKLNLSSIEEDIPADEQAHFAKSTQLLDEACAEVRHISHNMMPSTLIRMGLVSALKESAANISRSGKMKVFITVSDLNGSLTEAHEIALYRVCQEVLNNAIKYADAGEVHIELYAEHGNIKMSIADNGKGFDTKLMTHSSGIGWSNIYSRINMLGGRVDVQSILGAGTTVEVELPVN